MPAKIMIPFTKEQLQKDYAELQSSDAIAKKYQVSKKYVLNFMKAFGVDRNRRIPPVEEIRKLSEGWLSASEIANKLGFSVSWITKVASRAGIKIQDKYHPGFITKYSGYVMTRKLDHPFADSKGYVMVHRLVMESSIGRFLDPKELVHHKNGVKNDNRLENLAIMSESEHKALHASVNDGFMKSTRKKPCALGGLSQTDGDTAPDR